MAKVYEPLTDYRVEALGPGTWDAYAAMLERHGGVFGGCWCTYFHTMPDEKTYDADANRSLKEQLVRDGRAHAALVMVDDEAVAWCQYGAPEELPNIYHRKQYDAETEQPPDYRLTCIFVDRRFRHRGAALAAVNGALELIAAAGGGLVESYPHDNDGKRVAVLYDGTRAMFEQAGFDYIRPKGTKNCVMYKRVQRAGR